MMFEKPLRHVDRIFIHCSASEADSAGQELKALIRRWHVEGHPHNWSDIGYHYLIDKAGEVITARPLEKSPAAQKGHNFGTIAICVHGLDIDKFTEASVGALYLLCRQINMAYLGKVTFHGHCEVSAKTCPVFDYKEALILDKWGRMPCPSA